MTKDELITVIVSALPYASDIHDIDTVTSENAVRFTWKHDRFRASLTGMVEHIENSMLVSDNLACVMEALFKKVAIEHRTKEVEDAVGQRFQF